MLLHQLDEQYAGAGEARTAEALFDRAHETDQRSRQVCAGCCAARTRWSWPV